jgi:hypothetical protein
VADTLTAAAVSETFGVDVAVGFAHERWFASFRR